MIDRAAERTESGEKDDESRQQTDHTFLFFHISHQRAEPACTSAQVSKTSKLCSRGRFFVMSDSLKIRAEPACTSAREINSRGRFFIIFMR